MGKQRKIIEIRTVSHSPFTARMPQGSQFRGAYADGLKGFVLVFEVSADPGEPTEPRTFDWVIEEMPWSADEAAFLGFYHWPSQDGDEKAVYLIELKGRANG